MTKSLHPLIIIPGRCLIFPQGVEGAQCAAMAADRRAVVKVSVYVVEGKVDAILVEATVGNGKPPILLKGITKENIGASVLEAVEHQRGRRTSTKVSSQ